MKTTKSPREFSVVKISFLFLIAVFILSGIADATLAQSDPSKYLISARAGLINLAEGTVELRGSGETSWNPVKIVKGESQELQNGDVVRTGENGRLEILLSPGSFLRLNENSEFEMTDNSLDSMRLKILNGSAIIEATGVDGVKPDINIETPQSHVSVIKNGIYRVNVFDSGATDVFVRTGEARVDLNTTAQVDDVKIKGGKALLASNFSTDGVSQPNFAKNNLVTKFDKKKSEDEFDLWSKNRAESLVASNSRLTDLYSSYMLTGFFNNDWRYSSRYAPYGLWFYDPLLNCYTFSPFYYGWRSPYGYSYPVWYDYNTYYYSLFGNSRRSLAPVIVGVPRIPPPSPVAARIHNRQLQRAIDNGHDVSGTGIRNANAARAQALRRQAGQNAQSGQGVRTRNSSASPRTATPRSTSPTARPAMRSTGGARPTGGMRRP